MADKETVQFSFGPRYQRGICSECGEPAYTGTSTKCEKHRKKKGAAKAAPTVTTEPRVEVTDKGEIRVERPDPDTPKKDKEKDKSKATDDKGKRAEELEASILKDLNPVLVRGFALSCRPIDPQHFYVPTEQGIAPTELGKTAEFAEWEAKVLGMAAAELEKSPIGMMAESTVKPLLPYVYGIGAVLVLGLHAVNAMTLRQQLIAQYNLEVQTAAAQPMPAADPGTLDGNVPPTTNGHVIRPQFTEGDLAS